VPEFLSDEWLAALDSSARAAPPVPGAAPFVLEQIVTDTNGRRLVAYQVVFDDTGMRVDSGSTAPADVVFVTDIATAAAIARGTTNAQRALAAGRFQVRGNTETLVARAGALRALDGVFAAVRAETTYR
jgi:SCP-2 sterol transfer family